ncbi:MAG: hypothetical protein R3E86_16495 [Pseudomonadales bacterium]
MTHQLGTAALRLTAPEPDLDALSVCEATPEALGAWVMALPMANTADAATQVRQTTYEVARLKVNGETRMALLEQIRPILHYLCARLDRNAGTSQVHGDAIARLAQRLQTNLCSGYKSVILATLAERDSADNAELLTLAVHRALSDLSRTLLRTLQFYVAPADRLWLELNQLYQLAEARGIATEARQDPENHNTIQIDIAHSYLRSILLATCRPNQLRGRQLTEVFNSLELWSPYVNLAADGTESLYAIDLESDQGPTYARLLDNPVAPRGVRTDVLVFQLEAYLRDMPHDIRVPDSMTEDLVRHLTDAWGVLAPRSFRRARTAARMKLAVGMRATHYFLSGGVDFNEQVGNADAIVQRELNPFLLEQDKRERQKREAAKDVWDDAFDLRVRIPENPNIGDPDRILLQGYARNRLDEAQANAPADPTHDRGRDTGGYFFYDADALDTSPGGYRIRWNDPLPPHVQTGELVALREESDSRWCIGVVRWIRQDRDGTGMGIELLSPRAIPLAVRVIYKRGGPSGYARALMLPELSPINQPATLITPAVPFEPGHKVHFLRQGVQSTAQLQQCILKTESFNQFTFRMLSGYLENTQVTLKMTD